MDKDQEFNLRIFCAPPDAASFRGNSFALYDPNSPNRK
jgi:hypothetical protein